MLTLDPLSVNYLFVTYSQMKSIEQLRRVPVTITQMNKNILKHLAE